MKIRNFIVLGDIHYPVTKKISMLDNKRADEKTNAVPSNIDKSALALIVGKIIACCDQRKIDFIIFVGDYTSAGDEEDFAHCLEYFSKALKITGVPLVGVPGNHDVKRPEDFSGNKEKFSPFIKLANDHEIEINFTDTPLIKSFSPDINSFLYLVNSCLGCQEIWKSSKLASADGAWESFLHRAKMMFSPKDTDGADYNDSDIYERFDAPYISNKCSDMLQEHVRAKNVSLPIVIAHHNLFPQRQPRIALFPEMLNAGYIRDLLLELESPVLYIHGHIHDDPIQVVVDPIRNDKIQLVSISAPQIDAGFLEISSGFSDEGNPVATTLRNYKLHNFKFEYQNHIFKYIANKDVRGAVLSQKCSDLLDKFDDIGRHKYLDLETEFGEEIIEFLECIGEVNVQREIIYEKTTWIVRPGEGHA